MMIFLVLFISACKNDSSKSSTSSSEKPEKIEKADNGYIYPEILHYPRPAFLTPTDTLLLLKTPFGQDIFLIPERITGEGHTLESAEAEFKKYKATTSLNDENSCDFSSGIYSPQSYMGYVREYTHLDAAYFYLSLDKSCDTLNFIERLKPHYKDFADLRNRTFDMSWKPSE